MNEQKGYYAVIPASVRYDKELTPNAKLLYGEITALTNEKGFCWASNEYFANLYSVSKTSISAWISQLAKGKYITLEMIYKEGSKEILHRYIRLFEYPIQENLNTPIQENLKDNITSSNTTNNKEIAYKKRREFIPPTLDEVQKYITEKELSINAQTFHSFYSKLDWKDSQGKQVKSWKGKAVSWDNREVKPKTPFPTSSIPEPPRMTACPACGGNVAGFGCCDKCGIEYDTMGRVIG